MEHPPDDPSAWTDEQWIEWLQLPELDPDTERRVYAPRLDSSAGTVLGAAMVGLHKGMYGEVDKPDIVIEVGAKDDGDRIDPDPDDPSNSTVVIRRPADS